MKKKCALITGASGGIGSSIALRLARDGFAVAACYRSDEAGIALIPAERFERSMKMAMEFASMQNN